MSEPGQMNTVEDVKQKPYALVAARVRIPSPAFIGTDINIRNQYCVPISGGLWEIITKNQSPPL